MGRVAITITVDWEGFMLVPASLMKMRAVGTRLSNFGQDFNAKEIPITHFICPAYFTRTLAQDQRQALAKQIRDSEAIRDVDEVGVHIHAWKSLALEAGIPVEGFVNQPIGREQSLPTFERGVVSGIDEGYLVPLGAYPVPNIVKYLNTSIQLLQGFIHNKPLVSYRTGMWVTCDAIIQALVQTPLRYDASALPYMYETLFVYPIAQIPLVEWNIQIWSNEVQNLPYLNNSLTLPQYPQGIYGIGTKNPSISPPISQPLKVSNIVEIPDTGSLVPWTNDAFMKDHIRYAFDLAQASNGTIYISIGFHQESASQKAFFKTDEYPLTKYETEDSYTRADAIWTAAYYAINQSKVRNIGLEFLTIKEVGQQFYTLESQVAGSVEGTQPFREVAPVHSEQARIS